MHMHMLTHMREHVHVHEHQHVQCMCMCMSQCTPPPPSQAEVMVGAAQCKDVLLTNEVIGPQKLERLAGLAASHPDAAIGVLVDSLFGVDALSAAMRARAPSATISAYVEIECGQDRCAVPPA